MNTQWSAPIIELEVDHKSKLVDHHQNFHQQSGLMTQDQPIEFMGYQIVAKLSIQQLQRRIRDLSKDSANVFLSRHAKARMVSRRICHATVMDCLRKGSLRRPPEPNTGKGSLECRMERYSAGLNVGVVVALSDEDPSLVVVTVINIDG